MVTTIPTQTLIPSKIATKARSSNVNFWTYLFYNQSTITNSHSIDCQFNYSHINTSTNTVLSTTDKNISKTLVKHDINKTNNNNTDPNYTKLL